MAGNCVAMSFGEIWVIAFSQRFYLSPGAADLQRDSTAMPGGGDGIARQGRACSKSPARGPEADRVTARVGWLRYRDTGYAITEGPRNPGRGRSFRCCNR